MLHIYVSTDRIYHTILCLLVIVFSSLCSQYGVNKSKNYFGENSELWDIHRVKCIGMNKHNID